MLAEDYFAIYQRIFPRLKHQMDLIADLSKGES